MGMTEETFQALSNPLAGKYVWGIIPVLLHPKSKGTIRLKTKDPLDYPVLDSNLYSDSNGDDMEEMLVIIDDIFKISRTPAFQIIDSKYMSGSLPACSQYKHPSRQYFKCALRQITYPILHGVATCRMGPEHDTTAIVDNKAKVYGMSGLRVADASIIPFSLSAHPTPAVYMIGEKVSDFIRKEHGDL
ncbi:hypothetical protein ILUMI_24294 [Ignelater luminosus]|uniref:Glucose-methanol-choline oxidoreductase C-terminal domain-containing protein n=1 Tax=Ignelater luminosus TaxID=2038154 RepID=A0A8K0G114_IGNLU|nr:hypothetical protein ILUMI_24294 [Ignelater luminosus]